MATFPVKALAVATGIGGVTATGAGVIYLTSNSAQPDQSTSKQKAESGQTTPTKVETIANFLKADGRVLLTTNGNEPEWNTNWNSFKQKYNKDNIGTSSWLFDGSEGALDGEVATAAFKEKCKTNSESIKAKTNPLYEDVKNYCTKATENA